MVMYGFSEIVGVCATVVVGTAPLLPQCDAGAPSTPENTMFQTPPVKLFTVLSRANHCCWEPGATCATGVAAGPCAVVLLPVVVRRTAEAPTCTLALRRVAGTHESYDKKMCKQEKT
jgi:hypothetical protein